MAGGNDAFQVQFFGEGNLTEVDKYLAERLKEPLLHLVRNAFAHGIEPAEERVAAGKPAEATISGARCGWSAGSCG